MLPILRARTDVREEIQNRDIAAPRRFWWRCISETFCKETRNHARRGHSRRDTKYIAIFYDYRRVFVARYCVFAPVDLEHLLSRIDNFNGRDEAGVRLGPRQPEWWHIHATLTRLSNVYVPTTISQKSLETFLLFIESGWPSGLCRPRGYDFPAFKTLCSSLL